MTIIEAIKSGKRFRRPGSKSWLNKPELGADQFLSTSDGTKRFVPMVEDLLGVDWEIEEQRIEISKDELLKVGEAVMGRDSLQIIKLERIANLLGFTDDEKQR